MNNNISFSIIIPIYNRENYFHISVNSILNQTTPPPFEIILVDDGSTDGSGKKCDEYAKNYNNIKVIHQTNGGLSVARNAGMKVAQNNYILFCDDDDYYEPNTLNRLYCIIKQYDDLDLLVFGFKTSNGFPLLPTGFEFGKIYGKTFLYKNIIGQQIGCKPANQYDIFPFAWNKVFNKKIIKENNLSYIDPVRFWEDKIFWLLYLAHCDKLLVINDALYNYTNVCNDRLTSKFNIQSISMLSLKYEYLVKAYGKDFDLDNDCINTDYLKCIIFALKPFFNNYNETQFEEIKSVLADKTIIHWCQNAQTEDKFEKEFAKCVVNKTYDDIPLILKKIHRKEQKQRKRESVKKSFKIFLHRIKKLLKILFFIKDKK